MCKDIMLHLKDNNMKLQYLQLENGCIFVKIFKSMEKIKECQNYLRNMLKTKKN